MKSSRYYAVELLMKTIQDHSYSNLLLDRTLTASGLSPADKRLCSQLYYGVMERFLTLEHILRCYSKRPPDKLDISVQCILYLGLYQLKYCERIPDRAAVNESVALTKAFRKTSASGFVNAVLRGFLRDGKEIRMPGGRLDAMQVTYSTPKALIRRIEKDRGEAFVRTFLEDSLRPPPVTIRRNPLRADAEMETELALQPCEQDENAFFAECSDIRSSRAFQQGKFHVQDLASQLCCKALHPQPGETVLDVCAAPGGKSFTLAEYMENNGRLLAFDLHPHRVKLIQDGAERLGLSCVEARVQDASVFSPDIPKADRVLCDVPCSGYGVIRRKPEIRFKPLAEAAALPELQYSILETAARYVKPGGVLLYSTCTVLRSENEEVAERFLNAHPEFEPVPLTEFGFSDWNAVLSADYADCDGFFFARMRRKEDADGTA